MNTVMVLRAIEAANSVALEHPEDCDCVACRAAHGDPNALTFIVLLLAAYRGRES